MPKIISAVVNPAVGFGSQANVTATFDDGSTKKLFDFYDDELSFYPAEFSGLTEDQGRELFHKKDVAYLQS